MTEETKKKGSPATVSIVDQVTGLIVGASLFLILGSFLVPGYQGYMWLRTGEWTPIKTDVVFNPFDVRLK